MTTAPNSFGVAGEHIAGQQSPVGASAAGQLPHGGDPGGHQISGHSGKVLKGPVAVLLQRRLVPAGTVLSPAPDIGHREYAAGLQPGFADQ